MRTFKQLLRQPLKTIFGSMLIIFSTSIICISISQALAVRKTTEELNKQFSTVAIPVGEENKYSSLVYMEDEYINWLKNMATDNSEIIKGISNHGLLSAYIPELVPLNITSEKYLSNKITVENVANYFYQSEPYFMPYSCAMLGIILEEVNEPVEITQSFPVDKELTTSDFQSFEEYKNWYDNVEKKTVIKGYTIELAGTVNKVISLQEGYRNPIGRIARLTITVPTLEEFEKLNLSIGEQYIVYGMDYVDEYWKLIGELNYNGRYDYVEFEPYDSSKLKVMTKEERYAYHKRGEIWGVTSFKNAYAHFHSIIINETEYKKVNAISMSLKTPIDTIDYEAIRDDETGKLIELIAKNYVEYAGENGEKVVCTFDEFSDRYKIPTIAKLDGTVEEFLRSEDGEEWVAALERDNVNNHSFAIMGVDNLNYVADFANSKSKIVAGRNFTEDELLGEKKVCIIHEALAEANNLKVGDTISTSFYNTDLGLPYQKFRNDGYGIVNPTASFYFDTTPFIEKSEYVIVGLYRNQKIFPDVAENEYSFSANIIFVPKSSVESKMEYCDGNMFSTIVLENGKIDDFHNLAKRAGYAGRFRYYDYGYTDISKNFHNYETLAKQVVIGGIIISVILLLIFLILFPLSQKKNIKIMKTLGTTKQKQFKHSFISTLLIIIPSVITGFLLSLLFKGFIIKILQVSAEANLSLQIDNKIVAIIALLQMALIIILSFCVTIFTIIDTKIMGRR